MLYLGVEKGLVNKYCYEGKICFWGYGGLLVPENTSDVYVFDCSLHAYAFKEYAEQPESRILLSYKIPIPLKHLVFGGQYTFNVLAKKLPCTAKDIESCIRDAINAVESLIEEASKDYKPITKRDMIKSIFWLQLEKAVKRGIYRGLLLRREMLMDLVGRLGFRDTLRAQLKPAYILYSLDPAKQEFRALVRNKTIKLEAHKKMINTELILQEVLHGKLYGKPY
ncbi:MAG: hypothetical protein ABWW65_01005 [Thermoprotei archaeon]